MLVKIVANIKKYNKKELIKTSEKIFKAL